MSRVRYARRVSWWLPAALAVALALPGAARAADDDPMAFLIAARGSVQAARGRDGALAPASMGRVLYRGERLVVGEGGAATVFFRDGNLIELTGKSSIVVGGLPLASKSGDHSPELSGDVFAQASKLVVRGSRQTGLTLLAPMRGGTESGVPLLLAPRGGAVMDAHPEFVWRRVPRASRYRVSLAGEAGELWARELADTSARFPADSAALSPESDLSWKVTALAGDQTLEGEEASFRVLTPEQVDTVRDRMRQIGEQAGGPTSQGARFLIGSYLFGCGLYVEAARQFEALCRANPDSPGAHEALGNLYAAVGLEAESKLELGRAKDLGRHP
jgi:hypothetical protein